jgi:anti-anti-sigma regulatory factor
MIYAKRALTHCFESRDLNMAAAASSRSPGSSGPWLRVAISADGHTTRIAIHGEADVADVDQLDATLTGIQLDGTTSVRLDASDLAFFDVAVLRCLTSFAQRVKKSGRDVSTCGAPPLLADVARVLDLQEELGLS